VPIAALAGGLVLRGVLGEKFLVNSLLNVQGARWQPGVFCCQPVVDESRDVSAGGAAPVPGGSSEDD
jgi:hypothetical protein